MAGKARTNGQSVAKQQQRAEETKAALTGLQAPDTEDPAEKADLLEELSKSDLLAEIDDEAFRMLASKDIPTSNFDDEDVAEFRNYMDVVRLKKRSRYPHEGQDITGVLREVVHDDPNAGLDPTDRGDLLADEAFMQTLKARVLKARNGSLVQKVLSSMNVSTVRRENSDDGGGRLLSKIRN